MRFIVMHVYHLAMNYNQVLAGCVKQFILLHEVFVICRWKRANQL